MFEPALKVGAAGTTFLILRCEPAGVGIEE
jgi:hypothetical protein